jgi:hypothetical protein
MNKNEIVLFETADNEVSLQVQMQDETVWLTANQMAQLFERDEKTLRWSRINFIKARYMLYRASYNLQNIRSHNICKHSQNCELMVLPVLKAIKDC